MEMETEVKYSENQQNPVTVTKQKSLGRIAAGKKLAEFNKLHRWNKQTKANILGKKESPKEETIMQQTLTTNKEEPIQPIQPVQPVQSSNNIYYLCIAGVVGASGYIIYKYRQGKNKQKPQKPLVEKEIESSPSLKPSLDLFSMQ